MKNSLLFCLILLSFNTFAQIISVVSSATVITTLISNPANTFILLIFSIISLIGSLIPPINEYIITGLNNNKINESFEELITNKTFIENMNKELDYILYSKQIDEVKVSEIINECNEKTAIINRLLILT